MNRYNIIQNCLEVRNKHLFPDLIRTSFEKTGLFPLNRNVFREEDFAPSKATSTTAWTPDSFPDEIPSSDPAIPTDDEDEADEDAVVPSKRKKINP
jgi:hypothetical protein